MCSSVRGPAMAPSLVTWPMSRIGMPLALAAATSRATAPRTCEGLPGPPATVASNSVCTESTTASGGWRLSIVAMTVSRSPSIKTWTVGEAHPTRRARSPSCSADSSPEQYSAADSGLPHRWATCSARVDLPIPGSPPSSTTDPGTRPPPRTRSTSARPELCRPGSTAATASSATVRPAARGTASRFQVVAVDPSTRLFHSPQPEHRPAHLANSSPHDEQTSTVRAAGRVATAVMAAES